MIPKPKNLHQNAASRMSGRKPSPTRNSGVSGIQHTPNPVHYMPTAPSLPDNFTVPNRVDPSSPRQIPDFSGASGVHSDNAEVNALTNQGLKADVNPHPGEPGWGQYGNVWVYQPPSGLDSNVQNDLSYLSSPYLSQQYKDQAMNDLNSSGTQGPDYGNLRQIILSMQAGKFPGNSTQTPVQSTPQTPQTPQTNPVPQTAPVPNVPTVNPSTPTPPPVDPSSSVDTSSSSGLVNPIAPTANTQTMGNRNLPGFSAVNPLMGTSPTYKIPYGNFGNIATRLLQRM